MNETWREVMIGDSVESVKGERYRPFAFRPIRGIYDFSRRGESFARLERTRASVRVSFSSPS